MGARRPAGGCRGGGAGGGPPAGVTGERVGVGGAAEAETKPQSSAPVHAQPVCG